MYDRLSSAFSRIQNELELSGYLQEICAGIIAKSFNKEVFHKILINHGLDYSLIKADLIHLVYKYINIALEDHILIKGEKEDIKRLKLWFGIIENDFYF